MCTGCSEFSLTLMIHDLNSLSFLNFKDIFRHFSFIYLKGQRETGGNEYNFGWESNQRSLLGAMLPWDVHQPKLPKSSPVLKSVQKIFRVSVLLVCFLKIAGDAMF